MRTKRMPHETGIQQRAIVGRRITFADSELVTKYTLPFVDASWKVPFIVLDLLGGPPRILAGPLHLDGTRLRTPEPRAALRPIESVPTEIGRASCRKECRSRWSPY